MNEYGDELTADFLSEYGIDILDVFRGRLSPRRALTLVEQLPINSRFATAKRGGAQYYGWDRHAYMLADIFDAVTSLVYVTIAANSERPKSVQQPDAYPRPDDKPREKEPDILLRRLRGEATTSEAGPGPRLVPLPPS